MLWPLLLMALGFTFYYVTVLILRLRAEMLASRLRAMNRLAAEEG